MQELRKCRQEGGRGIDAANEIADVHRLMAEIGLIDERLPRQDTQKPHMVCESHPTQAILDGVFGTERGLGDIDAEMRLMGFQ